MTLSALATQLGGELIGPDVEFSSLITDTRALTPGSMYLALIGEQFDGNDFVEQAQRCGASGAIVSRETAKGLPQLRVADTHDALGKIAGINRARSSARVIALTGSQGKTTVKELIGAILRERASTLVTPENLNNTIGVPLTLLALAREHEFAVIEMGANRHGEIAFSVRVAQPDVALITNANAAHIEGFGSLDGIVTAKGEIIDGLKTDGTLLLNGDDANCPIWQRRAGSRKSLLFSQINKQGNAQYYAGDISINADALTTFVLVTPKGETQVAMNLLGKHNVTNGIAAAAAAMEVGASLDNVVAGLRVVKPVAGRLAPLPGYNGCRLIDDSYNASPSSFRAAIDVLTCHSGPTYLVVGDMRELGSESDSAHRQIGTYAASAGVDRLLAVGDSSRITAAAFGKRAKHFENKADLVAECKLLAGPGVTFLIKGSRGAAMDTVVVAMSLSEDL